MTEYEIVDALGTYSSGMQSWAALYMSLVTAFLATAYLAGKKLTKSQYPMFKTFDPPAAEFIWNLSFVI